MCEHTRTAIEVIQSQPRKTLTKAETLMLFQQVIGDNEKMGGRMTALENTVQDVRSEVADVKSEVAEVKSTVKIVLKILEEMKKEKDKKKKTFWDRMKEMPKYFWYTLWLLIIGGFGYLGVQLNIAGLGEIFKGGQ